MPKDVYCKIVITPETEDDEAFGALKMVSRVARAIPIILQPVTPMGRVKTAGLTP